MMYPPFWYNVNFTDDLIFKGSTTRFLRIHFPDIIDDSSLEYYVTIIPVTQTVNEKSSYLINGINAKDLFADIQSSLCEYNCLNIYGTKDLVQSSYDKFNAPDPSFWQKVKKGGQYAYRIDYDGKTDEILKFIILIGAYKPYNNKFLYTGVTQDPLPTLTTIMQEFGDIVNVSDIEHGIKGVCNKIVDKWINDGKSNQDIFDDIFKMDFREVNIVGYIDKKKETRENINNYTVNEKIINDDKTSTGLIRSNPVLSGNVKITTDSNDNIWLNSIDANPQLANSRFKKYQLSPNSLYAVDLYNFLDMGQVPADVLFDIRQYDNSYEHTKNEYNLQYDNYYGYGVSQLISKFYDEEFSFFAPLWLKEKLPEFFVILRIPHSVSISGYQNGTNVEITSDILKDAEIIKTFDMREGSKIGTYLKNIVNHSKFTDKPLYISFDKETQSTWTGVSYKDGVVSSKGEFLYDIFKEDRPIKELDEYLTEGFKRNSVICQNLINLEFLFDDNDVEDYSINRYIGLYVSEIELSKFNADKLLLSRIREQKPVARYGIDMEEYSIVEFKQHNDSGIKIPVRIDDSKIPLPEHFDENKFIAIKNREDNFSRVEYATDKEIEINYEKIKYREYSLYEKDYTMSLLTGIQDMSYQTQAFLKSKSRAQCVLNLYDTQEDTYVLSPGEELTITWDRNGTYRQWKMIANETGLQRGDWWDFPVYDIDTFTYTNTFNPRGTTNQVAIAIAGCINQFSNREFDAVAIDNNVYIITHEEFVGGNAFKFQRLFHSVEISDNLKIYGFDATYNISGTPEVFTAQTNFVGGNSTTNARAAVDFITASNVKSDDWFQVQSGAYSTLKLHEVNSNHIIALPYLDEPLYKNGKLVGFNDIEKYKVLELKDLGEKFYIGRDKRIVAFKCFKPTFSLLSIFPLKDFDFDFFTSSYAYSPVAELLKYFEEYVVQPGESKEIGLNEFYKITESVGDVHLEGFINDTWETIGIDNDYAIVHTTPSPENDIDFITNETSSTPQSLNSTAEMCLFNTFTPSVFHKSLDLTESLTDYFRRYIYTKKYDKIRIVNNTIGPLKFTKFLYMEKNTLTVNIPGSPGCELTIIDKDHLDLDMRDFKGFAGLRDILTLEDETIISQMIENEDFNRFFYGMLITEYDRLKENYLKEWAVKSMVVPYINKWVLGGTDARDNKYRFNLSAAFGVTNFSPSFEIARDSLVHTHEWFYLDEHPSSYPKELTKNSRGYMFQSLNDIPNIKDNTKTWKELLKETDADYFTKYFALGYPQEEYDGETILKPRTECYTFSRFIEGLNETYLTFRGAKIRIDELDEFGEVVKDSEKYNDYKFAAIISRCDRKLYDNNKLYDIEIIDNQKYKTIVFILTVFLHDHKLFNDLSYTALYNSKSAYKSDNVQKYIGLDCNEFDWSSFWDIRIDMAKRMNPYRFGVVADYQDVEVQSTISLERNTTSYSRVIEKTIKDLYNVEFNEFRKINAGSLQTAYNVWMHDNLPFSKIISFEGFANKYYAIANTVAEIYDTTGGSIVYHSDVSDTFFSEPIKPTNMYMYDLRLGGTTYHIPKGNTIKNDIPLPVSEVIDYYGLYYDDSIETNYVYAIATNPSWSNIFVHPTHNVYYLNSGEYYNEAILNKISFKEIAKMINEKSEHISYVSIDDDFISYNLFNLEFIEPIKFIKKDTITPILDQDKPDIFKTTNKIGYDLKTNDVTEIVYRYGGYYEPKMRNVLEYWVNEKLDFANYYETDFILCNTSIANNIDTNAIIKNHVFNKVNDTEIMQIADDTSYANKYPLVNAVAIDHKDLFVMKSNWDKAYYTKNSSVNNSIEIDGMIEVKETKAFLGSKVMNVPNLYEFYTFDADEYLMQIKDFIAPNVKPLQKIGNKNAIGPNTPSIVITFDLEKRIIREILNNDGIRELNWISANIPNTIVSNMTIDEKKNYIRKYIEKNIVQLYNYTDVIVYSKRVIDENTNPVHFNLSKIDLAKQSYTEYKNIEVERLSDLTLKLTIYTDTTDYMDYSIGIDVKRI